MPWNEKEEEKKFAKFQGDDCLLGKKLLLNFPIPIFFLIRKNDTFFWWYVFFFSFLFFFKKLALVKLVHKSGSLRESLVELVWNTNKKSQL